MSWERHAGWWQDNFTDGADAEYVEQIVPLARQLLARSERVLDLGTGEGQIARRLQADGARVVGVDPTLSQLRVACARGGGVTYLLGDAADLPFRHDRFDAVLACLVFEHIEAMDAAMGEVARVLRPGGRFALFLNHPLLQTPGSGWIEDHIAGDEYWRIGPYLSEQSLVEEVQKDVFIPFVHRPLHRYVNAMAANGMRITEWHEPAPPPGYLARAPLHPPAIPRLLVLVAQLESAQ